MQYWLFKSEPGAWSWDDQVKKGVEHWDGFPLCLSAKMNGR